MRNNDLANAFETGESAEVVAYRLMLHVFEVEGRPLASGKGEGAKLSRNVILDAYADCIEAVRGNRPRRPKMAAVGS